MSSTISSYENKYAQYYNFLGQAELDWYDDKAKLYFQTIDEDKKNDYNTLKEMKKIYKIYEYIANSYEEIGKKIYYNPAKKDKILDLLSDIIKESNSIVNTYNSIGISNYSERSMLFNQKSNFMKIEDKAREVKRNINNTITKIEKIEKTSLDKFSKLSIKPIKEKDITPFR